jgi:hypothetical protein
MLRGSCVPVEGLPSVEICVEDSGREGPAWVHMHEDEQTALTVAREAVEVYGGRLVFLRHGGTRNVIVFEDSLSHRIDPNRMFSTVGVDSSLYRMNGLIHPEARERALQLAAAFVEAGRLESATYMIALHNNGDGSFSVLSYQPDGAYVSEATEVAVFEMHDPDDFYIVTEAADFAYLAAERFNVVLQAPVPSDDGSLSVWAALRGIRYVNIEAQHGHDDVQRGMMHLLMQQAR